jgi:hypothetical protein
MLSPRVVPWIAPASLALLFILNFFPWTFVPAGGPSQSGWGTGVGGHFTVLGLFNVLFFLAALVAASASHLLPDGPARLPPALQQLWPWRSGIICGLAALAFLFLFLELCVGFGLEQDATEALKETAIQLKGLVTADAPAALMRRSFWLVLVVLFYIAAIVGAAFDLWLAERPGKPLPRMVINW